jgi:hypothetical protein
MIGANKILTVSYGTFSCTLEGFDEPFTTMKAIAEYFRDLAAEDRYFGAEPPTPDAEMLHKIAEREIQRRVEAKISENAVVLRQTGAPTADAVASAEAAPAIIAPAAPTAELPRVPAAERADAVANAPAAVADDSISDKLRRIRAAVAHAQTLSEPVGLAPAAGDSAFYEDLSETTAGLAPQTEEYAEPMDDDFGFTLDLDPQDLSDVLSLNAPDTDPAERADEAAITPGQEPEAVEADQDAVETAIFADETSGQESTGIAGAEAAESETAFEAAALPDAAAIEAEAEAVLPGAVQEALATEAQDSPDTADAVVSGAVENAAVDVTLPQEPSDEDGTSATEADVWEAIEKTGPQHLRHQPIEHQAEDSVSDDDIWNALDTVAAHADEDELVATDSAEEDLQEVGEEDEPMSPLASLLARTRAHVEGGRSDAWSVDLPQTAMTEAVEEDRDASTEETEAEASATDTPEDDGLLADIEAAIGAIDEQEAAYSQSVDLAETDRSGVAGKTILAEDAEEGEDFERLMEEANTKLEGAESRRRFSAISHLKAAVAATVADRILKPKDAPAEALSPTEPEIDRYRDDLSRAVRPRRPDTEAERVTARPATPMRPAPLVLVSEQRVDRENLEPAAVVRPRRVATTLIVGEDDDLNDAEPLSPEDAKSFTEFAERLGARSLAELLEVAAVYTATVEGKNSFSRPHLLRRVNAATGVEDFSREDYLRSFGSLLRQGRIQKIEPGRFSVTDVSPFMSEMRRAAN